MKHDHMYSASRRGLTLIELLVVASIVVLLASIALPTIGPMLEGQVLPGAAADAKIYFNRARTRAIETQRPCGVLLERYTAVGDPTAENLSMVLRQVESPPPYGGLNTDTKMKVTSTTSLEFAASMPDEITALDKLVRPGDSIQVNYQGKSIEIASVGGGKITLGSPLSNVLVDRIVPFKVFRQPVPSNAAPMAMPRGTLIDLEWSGIGDAGTDFNTSGSDPVMVIFSPSGVVDAVYYNGASVKVSDIIHLNIGTWERSSYVIPEDNVLNYQHPENKWLTITPRTGLLTVSDVFYPTGVADLSTVTLDESRSDAKNLEQSQGGR